MTRKTKYLIIIGIFLVLSMINLFFYYSYLKPIKISDINYSFNEIICQIKCNIHINTH